MFAHVHNDNSNDDNDEIIKKIGIKNLAKNKK